MVLAKAAHFIAAASPIMNNIPERSLLLDMFFSDVVKCELQEVHVVRKTQRNCVWNRRRRESTVLLRAPFYTKWDTG